eukprot:gene10834-16921_t
MFRIHLPSLVLLLAGASHLIFDAAASSQNPAAGIRAWCNTKEESYPAGFTRYNFMRGAWACVSFFPTAERTPANAEVSGCADQLVGGSTSITCSDIGFGSVVSATFRTIDTSTAVYNFLWSGGGLAVRSFVFVTGLPCGTDIAIFVPGNPQLMPAYFQCKDTGSPTSNPLPRQVPTTLSSPLTPILTLEPAVEAPGRYQFYIATPTTDDSITVDSIIAHRCPAFKKAIISTLKAFGIDPTRAYP